MKTFLKAVRRRAAYIVAVLVVAGIYGFARLPEVSRAERATMAGRFGFERLKLPELNQSSRIARVVHPQLRRISAWISSVGAAVSLQDLDGDGLPNDVCYVDTRIDKVIVAPVPGTPATIAPFELTPGALPYDPMTMAPMGCLLGDFNEDGLADILVYYWGRTPILFLRRDRPSSTTTAGLARESFVARELVAGEERWYTNAATLADIDGDGHTDLIIGNFFPDGARILDARAGGRDEMQDSMSRAQNGGRKHFFLWKAAATDAEYGVSFEEASAVLDEDVSRSWTLAIGAADLDGDLFPEIYFANDFGPDRLLHNRSTPGHLRFELLEGRPELEHAEVEGAWPRLVQGHGC